MHAWELWGVSVPLMVTGYCANMALEPKGALSVNTAQAPSH